MTETEDYAQVATPTAHASSHESGGTDEITVPAAPPLAHASSHEDGGADELDLSDMKPGLHASTHENGGDDELDLTGLPGAGGLTDRGDPAAYDFIGPGEVTPTDGLYLEDTGAGGTDVMSIGASLMYDDDLDTPSSPTNDYWYYHYAYGIDLGSIKTLRHLVVYDEQQSNGWYSAAHDSVAVYKSDDNVTWAHVQDFDAPTRALGVWDLLFTTPQAARYFKVYNKEGASTLSAPGGVSLKVTEIRAYTTGVGINADASYHELDLSAIVPEGTTFALLRCNAQCQVIDAVILFRKNGNTNEINAFRLDIHVPDSPYDLNFLVPLDANRKCEYKADYVAWTSINVVVLGYFS